MELAKKVELAKKANELRQIIIKMANRSASPHVASALSCIDILSVLYHKILNISDWDNRDFFIMSKAQAAMALYATLYQKGIINKEQIEAYYIDDGLLPGHLDKLSVPGIEVSSGSLGHGFNMGLGLAYGLKKQKSNRQVYVLLGDGETQEGSIWEGAMFSSSAEFDNFTAIIDYNNLQGYGRPRDVCYFEPVKEKWLAFGWHVIEVNGHDYEQLEAACNIDHCDKPKVIIAHTEKGKGISFMEDQLVWHYYLVSDEVKDKALSELLEKNANL